MFNVKKYIYKVYWLVGLQFGFDIWRAIQAIRGVPRYFQDYLQFWKNYDGRLNFFPCLHDWYQEAGITNDEYFLQDLHVARLIKSRDPIKHVDVGSRIDGFVAHVASFREIEVFDIRPVTSRIPGINFKQLDLMNSSQLPDDYCDSLSCLHALEHFGLGRYGDKIDPIGYISGFKNLTKLLRQGGIFYLSVPIGVPCVEFNAHRVFDPIEVINLSSENHLLLIDFAWVDKNRELKKSNNPINDLQTLAQLPYSLGIFTFAKN